jgi:osmoprotectant transport system permease protein
VLLQLAQQALQLPPNLAGQQADNCLVRNAWICPEYVRTRAGDILDATREHVVLTVVSVLLGILIALPLALLSRRLQWLAGVAVLGSSLIYTIPSLALFSLLLPFTGLTATTVVIGLALYSLTILVRNIIAGLRGVPADVREAARGMGFGETRVLLGVELPLAVPSIVAGIRIATVSTIALVTIGALVGYGGLGNLIYDGLSTNFKSEVLTASVLCVVLAVLADVLLLGVQRVLTPWERRAA